MSKQPPQSEEHDNGAAAGHLPVNRGTHPFRQSPPPHPTTVLTPRMAMLARRPLSEPPTPSTGPTRHQTMMEAMGEFSPIPPWLVNQTTTSSSNRSIPVRIRLSAANLCLSQSRGTSSPGGSTKDRPE